jgi:hypothetical protein
MGANESSQRQTEDFYSFHINDNGVCTHQFLEHTTGGGYPMSNTQQRFQQMGDMFGSNPQMRSFIESRTAGHQACHCQHCIGTYHPVAPVTPTVANNLPPYEPNFAPPIQMPLDAVKIPIPSNNDALCAAYHFTQAASRAGIDHRYAIVGGLSSVIYYLGRPTIRSLEILLSPEVDFYYGPSLEPVLKQLIGCNPGVLRYTADHELVVITEGNVGVQVAFIMTNTDGFPGLIGPTKPNGTAWSDDDPRPTWQYRRITPDGIPIGLDIPVLLPRLLLQQRILSFDNPGATYYTKMDDIKDIYSFLMALQGSRHQSFTDEEARSLIDNVKRILRFAEEAMFDDILDVNKWRYINFDLWPNCWR